MMKGFQTNSFTTYLTFWFLTQLIAGAATVSYRD